MLYVIFALGKFDDHEFITITRVSYGGGVGKEIISPPMGGEAIIICIVHVACNYHEIQKHTIS